MIRSLSHTIENDELTMPRKTIASPPSLAVAAVVLFLLDIAVRKFKFKWLHEIVRERKNGKYSGKSISGV